MTKAQLVALSAIRDLLDVLIVGQLPGVNLLLNAPVIYLHYRFAGPRALVTLFETVPMVATLPGFTAAALTYPDRRAIAESCDESLATSKDEV